MSMVLCICCMGGIALATEEEGQEIALHVYNPDTWTINEAGSVQVQLNESVFVQLDLEESQVSRSISFKDASGNLISIKHQFTTYENSFRGELYFPQAGQYTVQAFVDVGDESSDPVVSSSISVSVSASENSVGSFAATPNATTVLKGDPVRFTLTEAEGALEYGINSISDYYLDWLDEWHEPEGAEEGAARIRTAEIRTFELPAGVYSVSFYARGIGLQDYVTDTMEITVNDRESGIALHADEKQYCNSDTRIGVYAPNALNVALSVDSEDPQWYSEGNCFTHMLSWTETQIGSHTIRAFAQYSEEGEWVATEKTIEVINYGRLLVDTSGLPKYLLANQTATLTFNLPSPAEYMEVGVGLTRHESDSDDWYTDDLMPFTRVDSTRTVTIPAEKLSAGNVIGINFVPFALGYESFTTEAFIPVLPAAPSEDGGQAGAVLSTVGNDSVDIVYNQLVRFIVTPEEGHTLKAVRFYDIGGVWGNIVSYDATEADWSGWFENGNFRYDAYG